jgi:adhesin HecA-like repeat protein
MLLQSPTLAAPVPTSTSQSSTTPSFNLDLTSTAKNVLPPSLLGSKTVQILVGNGIQSISASSSITAGERLAVYQLLSTGHQSIVLGPLGNAIGGTFTMGANFGNYVSSVEIPTGVTALAVINKATGLNLSGSLTNSGNVYAVGNTSGLSTANISASSIANNAGGLISNALPASLTLPVYTALPNLSLSAIHDLINAGTISSAGALSLTAGGSINNSGTTQSVGSMAMQANSIVNAGTLSSLQGNIAMTTAALTNTGSILATLGNVSVASPTSSLLVDSTGGTITAGGDIDFSTIAAAAGTTGSLNLTGGTLAANDISFESPGGNINVAADSISGPVSVTGCSASVGTNQGSLNIDYANLSGDPIFYASGGSLDLTGPLTGGFVTNGADFVALASGNIVANNTTGTVTIDATLNNSPGSLPPISLFALPPAIAGTNIVPATGGAITLAAGVKFAVSPGQQNCSTCAPFFQILGPSSTGGSIFMPQVSLRTNGNNINLQAHSGTSSSGFIDIGNLETSGAGGGLSYALSPTVVLNGINGQSAGNISVSADGNLIAGFIRAYGGGGGAADFGPGTGGTGGNGGNISLVSANGSIVIGGDINASGGGGGGGPDIVGGAGGNGGNGGNITVNSPLEISVAGPILAAGGGGGGGAAGSGGGSFGGGGGADSALLGSGGGGIFGGGLSGALGFIASASGGGGFFGGGGIGPGGLGVGGQGIANVFTGALATPANFGQGGSGFFSGLGLISGGAGDVGQPGQTTQFLGLTAPGGAAGNGGNIILSGSSVQVLNSIQSYYPFASFAGVPFANSSIVTTGSGRIILTGPTHLARITNHFDENSVKELLDPTFTTTSELANKLPTDVTDMERFARLEVLQAHAYKNVVAEQTSGCVTRVAAFDAAELTRLGGAGIVCGAASGGNVLVLDRGQVVFVPSKDIVVHTQDGEVFIPAGAVAYVIETGSDAAIYCLTRPKGRDIDVVAAKQHIPLMPGTQVVLTRRVLKGTSGKALETLDPALHTIAFRRAEAVASGGGITALRADFSIPSALLGVAPLQAMFDSANPADKALVNHMLKDAVILTSMDRGMPYRRPSRP